VSRIANEDHSAAVPRRRYKQGFHRTVDDCVRVSNLLAQLSNGSAVFLQAVPQQQMQMVAVHPWIAGLHGDQQQVHQLVGQRHQPCLGLGAVVQAAPTQVARALEVVAPDRLAGELRLQRLAEQSGAGRRVSAVGADDQVVATGAAIGEARLDAFPLIRPLGNRYAEANERFLRADGLG